MINIFKLLWKWTIVPSLHALNQIQLVSLQFVRNKLPFLASRRKC